MRLQSYKIMLKRISNYRELTQIEIKSENICTFAFFALSLLLHALTATIRLACQPKFPTPGFSTSNFK
jgi:hypothetical protein